MDPFPPTRSRKIVAGHDAATTVDRASAREPAEPPTPLGVWGRVALSGALTIAMTQWPYAVCGFSLIGYFIGVVMILIAGTWAAYAAWLTRMGRAHIIALLLVFFGTALAANQVLPRVGYAPDPVAWGCSR